MADGIISIVITKANANITNFITLKQQRHVGDQPHALPGGYSGREISSRMLVSFRKFQLFGFVANNGNYCLRLTCGPC